MVLAVPLVTGAAAVTVGLGELTPAVARASTKPSPGSLLPSLPPLPLPTLPTIPLPTPSLPKLPLPTQSPAPSQGASPAPSGSSPATSHSGGGAGHKGRTKPKSATPAPSPSVSGGAPMPWAADAAPTAPSRTNAVGYALPVPASIVAAHPALIGEGTPAPRHAQAAGPVTLAVPAGTPVSAVTAGTFRVIPATDGTSTIVLSGTDGATYTYKNVTAAARGTAARAGQTLTGKAKAGTRIGTSGPGGLTFSISVPDVRGPVDADEAMQAWASGLTANVRSLPSTIAPATAPARDQVLVVTDAGAKGAASALATSLTGPLVRVREATLSGSAPLGRKSPLARQIAAPGHKQLVVVALANGTPAQAAALAALLPAGHQLLWVAPPGTTPKQAAAYRALVASRPGFRVESLPAALAPREPVAETASAQRPAPAASAVWAPADALTAGTLTAAYATTAYRLYSISSQAGAALSWAELQLGKPYKWAAAGPGSFDCSGLTMEALAQAGIAVPHNANDQWQLTGAHKVPESQLAPGDLVFFAGSDGTTAAPGHVGLYVGDGQIIDAPYTGAPVRLDLLASIGGYTGATNPYTPSLAPGVGALAAAQLAGLAVPAALSQYQTFARQLSGSMWGPSQFPYLYLLWQRESGWNPAAINPVSGAFGIPQSLPAGKMASSGLDWASDPYTQIIWGLGYISAAYGNPETAWAHELAFNWY